MNKNFKSITQPFSNEIIVDGKNYLYFGGTAYLGIPQNQDFINLFLKGIKKFGLNNGTSRSNNVQLGIYDEAENIAAERFGADSALITSSGYLAAQLTVKTLSSLGNVVYAPTTHPALWLNGNLNSNTNSFLVWKNKTVDLINASTEENWVLISNSMNNLFPEIFDFSFINLIHPNKKIILIVDDSHGIGVNNNGLGAVINLPKRKNMETIVVASMAKALGVDAGMVLGSKLMIEQLKNTNIFLGASPPAAAGLYTFIHAEEIYKAELEKLQSNIAQLSQNLGNDWRYEPDFPAFLIDDPQIDQKLLKENILISSFPYPTKDSQPINRIVLSSWHTKKDLNQLISVLAKKSLYQ